MTRAAPLRVVGFRAPDGKKIHATARGAYYELAKKLVLAKYPPELGDEQGVVPDGWTVDLANARFDKAVSLFWRSGNGDAGGADYFDTDRWKAFVWRVARFLAFVDKRRGDLAMRDLHRGLLPAEEHALLQRDLELAELSAEQLMAQAAAIRAEMRRRRDEES